MFKDDVGKAVKLLGDAFTNSILNASELELVKEEVSQEHSTSHERFRETLLENVHFNVFRDHMMGQPIKGDRDNIAQLSVDTLRQFHATNLIGDKLVVVGTGNINHEEFVSQVDAHFSGLAKQSNTQAKGRDKAVYNPALLFIRDDEMYNSNVGVFYNAPSIKDPDYYSFLLLKYMFGEYRIDKHAEHLNDVKKQYNS